MIYSYHTRTPFSMIPQISCSIMIEWSGKPNPQL
jgi:hypothetical protein